MSVAVEPLSYADFRVPLPAGLSAYGAFVSVRRWGEADAPAIVLMGGISSGRDVLDTPQEQGWWNTLAGPGKTIDPADCQIIGFDFAADETGQTAPSTYEQARVVEAILDALDIDKAAAIVGASYGGMVALAFAEILPERVSRIVAISAPAVADPSATAVREIQRRVVALGLAKGDGTSALAIARGLAMLTYRTPEEFRLRFDGGIDGPDPLCVSQPGAYLRARGDAYCEVMSPGRFLSLSASIDRHMVDPAKIAVPVLAIGANTDRLVPAAQSVALAGACRDGRVELVTSLVGHDMFLKQADDLGALITPFLETVR